MNAPARTAAIGDNTRLPFVTLDQLKIDYAHVETSIADLERKASETPPVLEDDEDLEIVTGMVGHFGKAAKRCDELRDQQGRPHLEAQRVINTFFKGYETRLKQAKDKLAQRATVYMNKKAEAQRQVRLAQERAARESAEAKQREVTEALKAGEAERAHVAQSQSDALMNTADSAALAAAAKPAELARTQTSEGTATLQQDWTFEIESLDLIDLEALRPFLPRTTIEQAMRSFVKSGRREIKGARIFSQAKARFRT